jgi:hypothetical protein
MKEAPGSSETSVLTRATRRNNPEDTILYIKLDNIKTDRRCNGMEFIGLRIGTCGGSCEVGTEPSGYIKCSEILEQLHNWWFSRMFHLHGVSSLIISYRVEVFTAVTMKNAVFWDVTPCGPCKNRHFGRAYNLHHQDEVN